MVVLKIVTPSGANGNLLSDLVGRIFYNHNGLHIIKSMRKAPLILILIVVVALVIFLMRGDNSSPDAESSQIKTITYTESGFSPSTLSVSAGTTVKFVNNSSLSVWPASAMHPTHKEYPGSDIVKCVTGEVIFDACRGIAPGESWSFTFDIKGTWKYHDHLKSSNFGTIVVK